MSLEALLIILMAGTEIFRPLRDLRSVLHQGMIGQSAANAVHALLEARSDAPAGGAAHVAGPARRASRSTTSASPIRAAARTPMPG